MISLQGLFQVFIYLVVAGLVFWLCDWFLSYVGVPEPFHKAARVILALAALIVVVYALFSLIGGGPLIVR